MDIPSSTPLRNPPADYWPETSAHWYTLPDGLDAGKQLFYFDCQTGEGEPEATVLFVHGNPESSYTYRHIRDHLIDSGRNLRLVALDHIGFGLSDQADFEMVDMHHAANLIQLVRVLDLRDLTLVVHDWGGPIGIGALLEEQWRVSALAVMNTTVFPMPSSGLTYTNYPISWLPWARTPHLIPDALWGGVAAYVVSHAAPQSSARFLGNTAQYLLRHGLRRIPPGTPEHVWSQQLRSKANARSSKRNVLQTPVWGHGYSYVDRRHGRQDNHAWYQRLISALAQHWGPAGRDIPCCGYFGQWDACGKDEVIQQWLDALPRMQDAVYRFPEVGHFIEEYKGSDIARSILAMMDPS